MVRLKVKKMTFTAPCWLHALSVHGRRVSDRLPDRLVARQRRQQSGCRPGPREQDRRR